MSTLATASARGGTRPGRAIAWGSAARRELSAEKGLAAALAIAFVLLAFVATGGVDLGPNTWVEAVMLVVGAALAIALILLRPSGPQWGVVSFAIFGLLAALTFASISWSVQPADSWVGANQTLGYLAAFGGAIVLARLAPARWRGLAAAVALAATVISGYALLVKVFPGALDKSDLVGRLRAPFDYWNATGLMAALGLFPCLWAGARRARAPISRALSIPAVTVLVSALVLSSSRGAIAAAIVGLAFWFWLVPLRLRAALVLAAGSAGAAAVIGWALATGPITHDRSPLHARITAGDGFGVVLVLVLTLEVIVGFACAFAADKVDVGPHLRRRIGIALVVFVSVIPIAGVGALAGSSRGLTGEISHLWSTLTNPKGGVGDTPGRLVELANSRPRFWGEGMTVGEHALLNGVGALGYGTARTRYTNDKYSALHAHSYAIETFADFGLLGVAVSLAVLVAWAVASGRTLGVRMRRREVEDRRRWTLTWVRDTTPAGSAELTGLLTLLAVVITFGVHSLIDWTWFVPGTAVPALVCAGWLAGRGPLARSEDRAGNRPSTAKLISALRSLRTSPGLAGAVIGVLALTVVGGWAIWQPLRSAEADQAAVSALAAGRTAAALDDARAAANIDPLSVDPLWELSAIYGALGEQHQVHVQLVKAISVQPANPLTWQQLGQFELSQHHPRAALGVLQNALRLDRGSKPTLQLIARAKAELGPGASS